MSVEAPVVIEKPQWSRSRVVVVATAIYFVLSVIVTAIMWFVVLPRDWVLLDWGNSWRLLVVWLGSVGSLVVLTSVFLGVVVTRYGIALAPYSPSSLEGWDDDRLKTSSH